jgi:hypothetical protein
MTDVIEAMHVAGKTTTEVFVAMHRSRNDHFGACSTWKSLDDAQQSVGLGDPVQAWNYVDVCGLPADVHAGEAGPPQQWEVTRGRLVARQLERRVSLDWWRTGQRSRWPRN